jgi:hypothetical protein
VRPTASDPGLGGLDPFGNPLSTVRGHRQGDFANPEQSGVLGTWV